MRRRPLASLLALAAMLPLVDARAASVPQARPRLTPEMIAAVKGETKPAPVAEPDVVDTSPVLALDFSAVNRAQGEAVTMTPFVVNQPKMKVPPPTTVMTPKAKLDVALQRRPGLRFLNFWGLNNGIALAMYEDDLAGARRREMADLMSLYLIK